MKPTRPAVTNAISDALTLLAAKEILEDKNRVKAAAMSGVTPGKRKVKRATKIVPKKRGKH